MKESDFIESFLPEGLLEEHLADRLSLIPEHLWCEISETPLDIPLNQATVFVDPLDATSSFVKGEPENVTCLIGIAINNVSKIGVVHKPYAKNSDSTTG